MRYDGLTKEQVDERVRKHQVNRTSDDISKTKKEIIREHTLTYFNFVNVVLGLFVLSTGQIKNMTFLMVVIVNTVIGIVQELKVKETIDKLSIVTAKHAVAFRDGQKQTIPTNEIVMDDVLYVAVGDQISTDCKVIESHGLELNEALLTGETKPVRKNEGDEVEAVFGSNGQFDLNFIRVNAQERFYSKLAGVTEPERKRKIIGEEFIRVFEEEAKKIGAVDFLAQGTIYPDVVES